MQANLRLLNYLLLIAIATASQSCQKRNFANIIVPNKPTQDNAFATEIGPGAIASQDGAEPRKSREINSCMSKLEIPTEELRLADSSNFGNRDTHDYLGHHLSSIPRFIVIHETVMDEKSTVNLFKTKHPNDNDQVSYHIIVARDGRLIRIVPDKNRAYGAGMSQFMGFTLRAKRSSLGSINNIALHISLVSPEGFEFADSHTGYTHSQYSSLAKQVLKWQMQYGIPMSRVTTHYAIDRSHSRYDPRSFHWDRFDTLQLSYAQKCGEKSLVQPSS